MARAVKLLERAYTTSMIEYTEERLANGEVDFKVPVPENGIKRFLKHFKGKMKLAE